MRLNLASRPPTVELRDPSDFGSFKVAVAGEDEPAVANVAFARYGRIVDRHTGWVTVDGVRELAEGSVDEGWERQFAEMLDAAQDQGWVKQDRSEIQAHVEWE